MNLSQIGRCPVAIEGETALIGTASELAVALDVLNGRQDRAVLEQLHPHPAEIIGGPLNLANVMRTLKSGDQLFLLDAIQAWDCISKFSAPNAVNREVGG